MSELDGVRVGRASKVTSLGKNGYHLQ